MDELRDVKGQIDSRPFARNGHLGESVEFVATSPVRAMIEVDRVLASFGLTFSAALVVYMSLAGYDIIYVLTGLFAALSFAIWLGLGNKMNVRALPATDGRIPFLFLLTLFLALTVFSISILHLREDSYMRPQSFFILVSLMAGVISLEILITPTHGRYLAVTLTQIVIVGLILDFSELSLYPTVVGIDPWYHIAFSGEIESLGRIPSGYHYSGFPLFHLEVTSASIVTGLDYKLASTGSITVPYVVGDVLLVFLIGRFLANQSTGLLAALFVVVANNHIMMGFWIEPITIAATLMILVMYSVFKFLQSSTNTGWRIVSTTAMVALIITHPLAALVTALSLFVLWSAYVIKRRNLKARTTVFRLASLFSIFMLVSWITASKVLTTLVTLIGIGFNREFFIAAPQEILDYATTVAITQRILDNIAYVSFFAGSIIGCLFMVSKRNGNENTTAIAVSGMMVLAIAYISIIGGKGIVEGRWLYIAQVWLSIPLSISLMVILCRVAGRRWQSAIAFAMTVVMAFFMIMSTTANIDNKFLSPDLGARFALTDSEYEASIVCNAMSNATISTDLYYTYTLMYSCIAVQSFDEELLSRNFSNLRGDLVLVRTEIQNEPFIVFTSLVWRLDYDILSVLDSEGFSEVYDCGTVHGYTYTSLAS